MENSHLLVLAPFDSGCMVRFTPSYSRANKNIYHILVLTMQSLESLMLGNELNVNDVKIEKIRDTVSVSIKCRIIIVEDQQEVTH
jgi:hypothetical protein